MFLSILFSFPLYLQNVVGDSALMSGSILLFMTIIMAILSPIAGKWVDVAGDKITILFSMALFLILSVLMLFIGPSPNYLLLVSVLLIAGTSIGVAYISSQTGVQSVIPESKKGAALAVYLTIAWLACSLGVSVSGTSIALGSKDSLLAHLKQSNTSLDSKEFTLTERASRGLSPSASLANTEAREIAKAAFAAGIHTNAWVLIIASCIGVGLALRLRKSHSSETKRPQQ